MSNALAPVPENALLLYSNGSPERPVEILNGLAGSAVVLEIAPV